MKKNKLQILPAADGIIILKPETQVTPALCNVIAQKTFDDILDSPLGQLLDYQKTNLLYSQLSPVTFLFDASRFNNDLKDDSKLQKMIRKFQKQHPDAECSYTVDTWIPDNMLPDFAKKIGIRFHIKPYFQRVHYLMNKKFQGEISRTGPQPSASLFCDTNDITFDITLNKVISVVSRNEAPKYKQGIQKLNEIYSDKTLRNEEREKQILELFNTLSPAELGIIRDVFFENAENDALKPQLHHELKHIINEILLSSRHAKSDCEPLNGKQMLKLMIHDEISASSQEILTVLSEIHQNPKPITYSELSTLIPLHYKKFKNSPDEIQADMLMNPQPIIRELSQNWLKHHYKRYYSQFRCLFRELKNQYPSYLWSNNDDNSPAEYELQKSMLYCFEINNPHTGKKNYINCSSAINDDGIIIPSRIQKDISAVTKFYKQTNEKLTAAGITPEIIEAARKRNYDYARKSKFKTPSYKSVHDELSGFTFYLNKKGRE